MPEVEVFVPVEGFPTTIKPGSAIVGQPSDSRSAGPGDSGREAVLLNIYYEGDVYGHMRGFEEMLLHAADRMLANYPTIARAWVPFDSMRRVGWYQTGLPSGFSTLDIEEPDLLRAWQEHGTPAPNPTITELTDLWKETK
jgi:hypothetical protein